MKEHLNMYMNDYFSVKINLFRSIKSNKIVFIAQEWENTTFLLVLIDMKND